MGEGLSALAGLGLGGVAATGAGVVAVAGAGVTGVFSWFEVAGSGSMNGSNTSPNLFSYRGTVGAGAGSSVKERRYQ